MPLFIMQFSTHYSEHKYDLSLCRLFSIVDNRIIALSVAIHCDSLRAISSNYDEITL